MPVAALKSEGSLLSVSAEDQRRRLDLVGQLRDLPRDALHTMRHFQAQVGCLNRCSFCSQGAGTTLWNMSRRDLANLVAALKVVALEWARDEGAVCLQPLTASGVFSDTFVMPPYGLIANKRVDRPGVIYCYLDNDPAAYPHLDDMLRWLHEDLGVKVRIASVGYSRRNSAIHDMHARISASLMDSIAGLRISFSPYTYGWTRAAQAAGSATRDDFERDVATMLHTYRSTFLSSRRGRKGACVELRFRPLVVPSDVEIGDVGGLLTIQSGPYLVVQREMSSQLDIASITDAKSHGTELSVPGAPAWMIYGDEGVIKASATDLVSALLRGDAVPTDLHCREVLLHHLRNDDGDYYAVNAERLTSGVYAKYFYPKTGARPGSGYIDGERYALNRFIEATVKNRNRTWDDAAYFVQSLNGIASDLHAHDPKAAQYIRDEIMEVVSSYIRVLSLADYPPSAFFDKDLTVETGHICNLGRAFHEYKAIASRPDLPLTPNHERAFGLTGELAAEGQAWRLAVVPVGGDESATSSRGGRNAFRSAPSILMERLDLAMTATPEGQTREKYFLRVEDIETITLKDAKYFPVIPGHAMPASRG